MEGANAIIITKPNLFETPSISLLSRALLMLAKLISWMILDMWCVRVVFMTSSRVPAKFFGSLRICTAPNITLLTTGGLLHVRTIGSSTMYIDAEAKVFNQFAWWRYLLIDKKISEIADEGIFSKVKTLPYRRFLLIQSRCFEDRAYSLVSNFVYNNKHKLRNFG